MGINLNIPSNISRFSGSFAFPFLTPQLNTAGAWAVSGENTSDPWHILCTNGTGTNGNNATWYVYLPTGTYDLWMSYRRGANEGIFDTYLDGTAICTGTDKYTAGNTYGTLTRIATGISVTTDGQHSLKLVVNGKNAGSSGYYCSVGWMAWVKTA